MKSASSKDNDEHLQPVEQTVSISFTDRCPHVNPLPTHKLVQTEADSPMQHAHFETSASPFSSSRLSSIRKATMHVSVCNISERWSIFFSNRNCSKCIVITKCSFLNTFFSELNVSIFVSNILETFNNLNHECLRTFVWGISYRQKQEVASVVGLYCSTLQRSWYFSYLHILINIFRTHNTNLVAQECLLLQVCSCALIPPPSPLVVIFNPNIKLFTFTFQPYCIFPALRSSSFSYRVSREPVCASKITGLSRSKLHTHFYTHALFGKDTLYRFGQASWVSEIKYLTDFRICPTEQEFRFDQAFFVCVLVMQLS